MKIIIIYPNSFPYSGAATNRIISIARGLVENNNDVEILINRPTEKNNLSKNNRIKGIYKGIKFKYLTKTLIWPDSKIEKILVLLNGVRRIILTLLKEEKVDIIISAATTGFVENYLYSLISKFKKAKFIHTLDEYPWVILRKENYNSLYRIFYLKFYYKLFDGFIIMTKTLIDYYKPLVKKDAKLLHIPMSVELDRFDIKCMKNKYGEYVAYCGGDKSGTKDGVDILVKSFNLIKNDFPELDLLIIGVVHPRIKEIIEEYNLSGRVKLLGFISSDLVPQYLKNAIALCLARPANKQAEGGFPTKIGEYLASANPVIVTNVGEISDYLQHQISAYIAKPDDIKDFSFQIKQIMNNREEAIKVGQNGRIIAEENFDYYKQGRKVNLFLRKLC